MAGGEYRQVSSGVGVALFIAGMAIWPTGLTAHPMSWVLWSIGVGVALLGVYVFTAAYSTSRWFLLPGKRAMLRREQIQHDALDLLGALRVWGMVLTDQIGTPVTQTPQWKESVKVWGKDLLALVTAGWGRTFAASFAPPYATGGSGPKDLLRNLDRFIARCHTLRFRTDCELDMTRFEKYLGANRGATRPARARSRRPWARRVP